MNHALYENRLANEIMRGVFDLNLVGTDYVLHGEERAENQWWLKHAAIARLIAGEQFATAKSEELLGRIRDEHANLHRIFLQLIAQTTGAAPAAGGELKERYIGQLDVRTRSIMTDASALARTSSARVLAARRRAMAVVMVSVVVMAGFLVTTSLVFDRSVVAPIHRLHKGTEIIGSGNLDYKVGTPARDEVGQLARAFDEMTDRLKAVTISRNELAREVAERKRAEEELKRTTAELARSNAELEQFTYVASHDLQKPLRTVTSFLQLLERRYKDKLDRDGREFIEFGVDGARRMGILIQDLLAYSRVSTRGRPMVATDTAAALARALANLQVAIRESRARVTHDDLPAVMGDAMQLTQLFQNLVGNAIKYRSDKAPEIHVGAARQGNEWVFAVRDNGIGIEPQYFDRIFVVFQRLHGRGQYSGTGIGLAICKKIVDRHGGRIWVESEPGKGSTFFFSLPSVEGAGL